MKDLDKFSEEEKKHLNYLGSKLLRPGTDFDQAVQRIFDEMPESKAEGPAEQGKQIAEEEANG
jgi:hypothetical protein